VQAIKEESSLLVGHSASCEAVDKNGKSIKKFSGRGENIQSWIEACLSGKQSQPQGFTLPNA